MKIRADFVTNSSSSSFIAFHVKNKALFQYLTNLGLKFEDTEENELEWHEIETNELSDRMRIVLPSGRRAYFHGSELWGMPCVDDGSSISAWIVFALQCMQVEDEMDAWASDEVDDDFLAKNSMIFDQMDGDIEEASIEHASTSDSENEMDAWASDEVDDDFLGKKSMIFDQMDGDIEEASIEHVSTEDENEIGTCYYTEVHNGKRLSVNINVDSGNIAEIETENCDGLEFVVTGKLQYFENRDTIVKTIEDMGGSVSDSVSKNTNYLICNDIHSTSSKMEKAKELGISVLTEIAFIRRFCDPEDYGICDNDLVGCDADTDLLELTSEGGVLDFVLKNGTSPIVLEVWKDGRWQRNV